MTQTALRRGSQEDGNTDYFTGCPIGGGFIWYGLPNKIPSNCRICDNSTLAISSFAKLYENLGGAWGQSGSDMNLPDLRGRFPRGVDGGANRDPDRAGRTASNAGGNTGDNVGSIQGQAFQTHTHSPGTLNITSSGSHEHSVDTSTGSSGSQSGVNDGSITQNITPNNTPNVRTTAVTHAHPSANFAGATAQATASGTHAQATENETRPVNAAVYFVIRVD
jgi:microcystin-dependent protein